MSAGPRRPHALQAPRAQSQTLPSGHGAAGRAGAGAMLPRVSASGDSGRRTSANGGARVSSSGVLEDDMAPYKRTTFSKTSMQVWQTSDQVTSRHGLSCSCAFPVHLGV